MTGQSRCPYSLHTTFHEEPGDKTWPAGFIHMTCPALTRCEFCHAKLVHVPLVIAVDGACRDNGMSSARASLGVYVNEESPFNMSEFMPGVRKNQVAELMAGIRGLQTIRDIHDHWHTEDVCFGTVYLQSDSAYFVSGMTEWMAEWKRNGFRNFDGQPVVNRSLFKAAIRLVEELKIEGISVFFWHIERYYNRGADKLANEALNLQELEDGIRQM